MEIKAIEIRMAGAKGRIEKLNAKIERLEKKFNKVEAMADIAVDEYEKRGAEIEMRYINEDIRRAHIDLADEKKKFENYSAKKKEEEEKLVKKVK